MTSTNLFVGIGDDCKISSRHGYYSMKNLYSRIPSNYDALCSVNNIDRTPSTAVLSRPTDPSLKDDCTLDE
ncbi:hypothetical protein J437_LFUL002922 [Ladona fulva]|uniref:Uncharacterized protein n=1 Tax=Ladona fulva TaxID=123851 RepID=A0A8K0KB28_LADFU|nr:hypothetical protein J437_LFUL002922 [Ladona fulva]